MALIVLVALLSVPAGDVVWWFVMQELQDPHAIKHDPIEDDPDMKPIFAAAEQETEQQLAEVRKEWPRGQLGYCHLRWGVKQRILKEKYGVEWRTPAQMNPRIAFD
ncbi:MAG: hypothetical protein JWO38_7397 [Gemmataceae bacterium]|nr:hypothetical protein [Gemmataceae bacterium]